MRPRQRHKLAKPRVSEGRVSGPAAQGRAVSFLLPLSLPHPNPNPNPRVCLSFPSLRVTRSYARAVKNFACFISVWRCVGSILVATNCFLLYRLHHIMSF